MKHGYPISPRNQSNSRWNGETDPLPSRSKPKNTVKAHDYGNSVLGPAWCFAGGFYATRNNDQPRCLLRSSAEAPKIIAKQTVLHAVKRCFAPPR
ncbi:hypothetical protein TNCT_529361 [Trichonephila clavata]|uniref:Uncharacterized protein n=1 Tax=Trichonephila clavata TaxID=2740835 RepID=A0A8X6FY64_TRICU|nr:hypothetical protein TNCT_529361 [Trichonephila clavata]